MQSARARLGRWTVACAMAGSLWLLVAASAPAAVYPPGQGTFSGSAQGWQAQETRCDLFGTVAIDLLCTPSAGYAGDQGIPPGSLALNATVVVNLLTTFTAGTVFESPEFTVKEGGAATLHLDRQFDPEGLVDLAPTASYAISLEDRTGGGSTVVQEESLGAGAATFTGKDAVVNVKAGHTYVIRIAASMSSNAKVALLSGGGSMRFDNVSLATGSDGDGKGGGGDGKGGANTFLTDRRLLALLRSSSTSSAAVLRGKRLFVKVNCPRKVGRACVIVAQGMLNRRRAATAKRRVKVGKGKGRQVVLRVKPRLLPKVKQRKRLLVRQQVRAGRAKATFFKQRRLIRRR